MDQVDNIIFQNFVSLGWDKEDASSLQDLDVSDVSKLMVKCLTAINPECDLPELLPHNMSQRFKAAAKIAEAVKELGYGGDLGYHSILYSNESDLRRIFTFLTEKLPKDAPALSKTPAGKPFSIQREACRKINEMLQRPWIPPHCSKVARKFKGMAEEGLDGSALIEYGTSHTVSFCSSWTHCNQLGSLLVPDVSSEQNLTESWEGLFELPWQRMLPTFLNSHTESLGCQLSTLSESDVTNSGDGSILKTHNVFQQDSLYRFKEKRLSDLNDVFETSNKESRSESYFPRAEESKEVSLEEPPGPSLTTMTEADLEKLLKAKGEDAERKIGSLSQDISEAQEEVSKLLHAYKDKMESINSLEQAIEEKETEISKEEKKLVLLQKTSSLASDPSSSLEQLKNALEANKEKEDKLLRQWLKFKEPLEEELKEATLKLEKKKSKQTELKKEIAELRKTTLALIEETKRKETLLVQLNDQKAKMTKGINRAVYTKQILDISAKVRKQKQEIEKILSDTRVVQKEINNLTGKLQRTFAVVEDASFKAASANEHARPIYRSVIAIHEEFGALVETIRVTGSVQREIADLHQQLNSEKSKNIEDNVKRLEEDFNKLKMENAYLKKTLKNKS